MERNGFQLLAIYLLAAVTISVSLTVFDMASGYYPVMQEDRWYRENPPFSLPRIAEWSESAALGALLFFAVRLVAWAFPRKLLKQIRELHSALTIYGMNARAFIGVGLLLLLLLSMNLGELVHGEPNARQILPMIIRCGFAGATWAFVVQTCKYRGVRQRASG